MSIIARVRYLVRDYGVVSVATKLLGRYYDSSLERSLGIDTIRIATLDGLTVVGENSSRGNDYEGTRWMPLRKLIPHMQRMVAGDSALVDCGCGKGKVLLVAAECGVKYVRGVEFARELSEIAKANLGKFQRKQQTSSDVQIICSDILDYPIQPNDSMFFLFNPFDEQVLEKLLAKIAVSQTTNPRKIVVAVAFLSDTYRAIFDKNQLFRKRTEEIFWACRFTLFSLGD